MSELIAPINQSNDETREGQFWSGVGVGGIAISEVAQDVQHFGCSFSIGVSFGTTRSYAQRFQTPRIDGNKLRYALQYVASRVCVLAGRPWHTVTKG